jgi:hypothetical protein
MKAPKINSEGAFRIFLQQILKKLKELSRIMLQFLNYQFFNIYVGDLMMRFLEEIKKWLGEVTEIFLLLIAIGIAVEILFGSAVPFFGGIVANLTALISTLGENGLVGLIALSIILFLFYRKKAVA